MITKAKVVLRNGRQQTSPITFSDKLGIAAGNKYMLNLEGKTAEWRIEKIVEILEENP